MKYLNVYDNHDSYSLAKANLPKPNVSYDNDHMHYLPNLSGILLLYNKYGTQLLYSKQIQDGYSDNVSITLDGIDDVKLGGPFAVYDKGMTFNFRVYVPFSDTEGTTYKIISNTKDNDENFDITASVIDNHGELASYIGKRVTYGLEIKIKHRVAYNGSVYTYSGSSISQDGITYYMCSNSSAVPTSIYLSVDPEYQEDGTATVTVYGFNDSASTFAELSIADVTFTAEETTNEEDDK